MDWANRDFVHLFSLDLVEGIRTHSRLLLPLVANGLEPGVGGNTDARLFVQLPLEAVQRGQFRSELVISVFDGCKRAGYFDATRSNAECGGDQHVVLEPSAIQREKPRTRTASLQEVVPPRGRVEDGNRSHVDSMNENGGAQGPSTEAATCWTRRLTTGGI